MIVGTGVHELVRINTILIIAGALIIFIVGQVRAVTCEECREIEKDRQRIQEDVNSKEKDLNTAFEKKEFKKVREIRLSITELRKKMLELRSKDEECRNACRPDVVKAAECSKIREEIIKLENPSESEEKPKEKSEEKPETKPQEKQEQKSEAEIAKIDGLYRDLQRCNKELRVLKKKGD
jgi:hypothetical protein